MSARHQLLVRASWGAQPAARAIAVSAASGPLSRQTHLVICRASRVAHSAQNTSDFKRSPAIHRDTK
jgi:hypothetical protein